MEFVNTTPFTAALYRGQLSLPDDRALPDWQPGTPLPEEAFTQPVDDEVMQTVLVLACRYPITPWRALGDPSEIAQRTTLEPDGPADPAYGLLLEPGPFPRAGTDLIVLGDAISPAPVTESWVRIRVGPYDLRLRVFGDRVWDRRLGKLVPSPPEPFTRMPLTWARAFGGTAKGDYGPIPFAANPLGRGYCLKEAEAEASPLPNIEDPEHPVERWSDQPEPVGCGPYPSNWWLRLSRHVDINPAAESVHLRPEIGIFDRAYPRLSGQRIDGGELVLEGVHAGGPIVLPIPRCPAVAEIQIGDRGGTRELTLDEIVVDLHRSCVDFLWRKGFTYRFRPHETRVTAVRTRNGG